MSKTVWITGASSGIGREFARRYARLGFRLILTARRTDRLEALAAELTAKHSTFCRILPADLEQESECARLCEALTDERIDIFINNAGFGVCGSFLETSGEKELSMAKVNVLAMHQLFKFAVKRWRPRASALCSTWRLPPGCCRADPIWRATTPPKRMLSA